jgi:F-type H+-transporting ATPase subunit delta
LAANTSSANDGKGAGMLGEAAKRYAGAAFDLALDTGAVDAVEAGLNALAKLINSNPDLRRTLRSPLYKSEEKAAVLGQLGEKVGVPDLARRLIGVVAQNGRAGDIPNVARAFAEQAARHRGASRAIARVAAPLSKDQELELQSTVSKALGRTVEVEVEVDPALLGGMQLKLGSRLIDASVRTKLKTLTNIMKGA